jgi:hypothetical protein
LTVQLPKRAGTQFYECWYVDPGGQQVSAGTFIIENNGSKTLSLTSAEDPTQFKTMEIRAESLSNDGARRGMVVLSGQAKKLLPGPSVSA